uniref:Uncharacterized protein n=1 Tax=Medicago truncatula TaxID=3880 RepID=I3S5U1_MEDTR|nr:unknown [Medicago truncatula]
MNQRRVRNSVMVYMRMMPNHPQLSYISMSIKRARKPLYLVLLDNKQ